MEINLDSTFYAQARFWRVPIRWTRFRRWSAAGLLPRYTLEFTALGAHSALLCFRIHSLHVRHAWLWSIYVFSGIRV